jgi:hypothetical protein
MKRVLETAFLTIFTVCLQGGATIGSPAPDLVLKDQYDNDVRLNGFRGETVLLVCGDRNGSEFTGAWAGAVREKFDSTRVRIVHIANLQAVPVFIRGFVKRRFVEPNADGRPKSSVVLDWGGDLPRVFGFREGLANVYLIDRNGVFQFTHAGKGTAEEVAGLLTAIDRTLAVK